MRLYVNIYTYKKSSYALIKRVALPQCGTFLQLRTFTPKMRAKMMLYKNSAYSIEQYVSSQIGFISS